MRRLPLPRPPARRRLPRPLAGLLALALGLLPVGGVRADDIEESGASRAVTKLLETDPGVDATAVWRLAQELKGQGRAAVRPLKAALEKASPGQRLAIGRALVLLDEHTQGLEVVRTLVGDEKADTGLRRAGLRLLGDEGELEEAEWLGERLDLELVPEVKLAMAQAVWRLNRSNKSKGKEVLLQFLRSTDPDLRAQGALALGEIGVASEAKGVLTELRDEPTERGRSAALLLRLLYLEQEREAQLRTPPSTGPEGPAPAGPAASAAKPGAWPLLDEIRDILQKAYYDVEKVQGAKLEDAAASGLTTALDPHSGYLSPEENGHLLEGLDPTYGGVGAYVQNDVRNGDAFTISRPIFGGPIDRAGLRAGDVITAIDAVPTEGLSVDECVRRLKGPAGTPVVITVFRRGWTETRDVTLTRARITVPTTAYDVLPGRIGFLQITSFSEETAAEVAKVLDVFEAQGVEGIAVDLRNNGGGYLRSAVEIASQWLPKGALVVTERGRPGVMPVKEHRSTGAGEARRAVPLVVLMNQFTASAAEILAGALQVHGRARLVGTMSYGKGTVQFPLELSSRPGETYTDEERVGPGGRRLAPNGRYDGPEKYTDTNGNGRWDEGEPYTDGNQNGRYDAGEPFKDANGNGKWDPGGGLKVTVGAYYLPDGRNLKREVKIIDKKVTPVGGLHPDVEPGKEELDLWELQAQSNLEKTGAVRAFVDRLFEQDAEGMRRLARSDRGDPAAYPGFDAFWKSLDTKLSPQGVRWLVRWHTRRVVGDELRRELVGDVVDDAALKAALRDLFKTLKKDIAAEPDLACCAAPPAEVPETPAR